MSESDEQLRDRLADQESQLHLDDSVGVGFKAGWDAARANPLRDEKRLWDECERLRKERDRLKAQLAKAIEQRNIYHTICDEDDLATKTIEQLDAELERGEK